MFRRQTEKQDYYIKNLLVRKIIKYRSNYNVLCKSNKKAVSYRKLDPLKTYRGRSQGITMWEFTSETNHKA